MGGVNQVENFLTAHLVYIVFFFVRNALFNLLKGFVWESLIIEDSETVFELGIPHKLYGVDTYTLSTR